MKKFEGPEDVSYGLSDPGRLVRPVKEFEGPEDVPYGLSDPGRLVRPVKEFEGPEDVPYGLSDPGRLVRPVKESGALLPLLAGQTHSPAGRAGRGLKAS